MQNARATILLYASLAVSLMLCAGTVVYRYWLGPMFYHDDWAKFTRAINTAPDVEDRRVQELLQRVGDARVLVDLGLVYALGDTLWVNGEQVTDTGVLHVFDVLNEEPDVVRIVNIETSCGCAKAELSSHELPPDGRARLALTISHDKLSDGPHNYWASLRTESGQVWRYGVKVDVLRAASWNRTDLFFADISATTPTEITTELRLVRPPYLGALEFEGIELSSELVHASVLPVETTVRPDGTVMQRVPVKLSPVLSDIGDGQNFCYLKGKYSSRGAEYEAVARVHWTKISPYTVTPARLLLRSSENLKEPLTVVVAHAGQQPFGIASAELPDFLSLASDVHRPGAIEHTLFLNIMRDRLPERHSFEQIVVRTDHDGDNTVTIPVTFLRVAAQPPSRSVSPLKGETR